jgi:hypothetical protein
MAEPREHDQAETDEQGLERALERTREDLPGDMEENRNLTGSTTWETLSEEQEEEAKRAGSERQAGTERAREEPPNPPRTTTGPITAPKFGSATSGGGELEPGPERD